MSGARKPEDMPRDLWGEPEINGQPDDYGEYGAYRNPIGNLPESAEFPVGTLPRAGRRLVEESARAIGCPTEFVALPMLVVLGTAIGNSRVLKLKAGWEEGASIYGAVVAEPGEKKSPAASVAIEPAVRLQTELRSKHLNKLDEHKRLLSQYEVEKRDAAKAGESAGPPSLEPRMARTVVEDTTVEALAVVLEANPRGVGVFRDELSAWALSHNQYKSGGKGSDRQFWLSAWSNRYASVDRKSLKEPLMLPRPFVGLFGAIQPAILPEIGDGRGDGLLDRFLLAYPHPKPSRWTDDEISREARDDCGSLYRKLRRLHLEIDDHGAPNPGKVVFAPDARTVFVEAVDGHRAEMEELEFPARLKGSWSKLEAYLARLSLILALCRCVDDVAPERVENRDVLGAVVLLDYFKVQTRRVYMGLYGEDPLDLLAADLRRLLEERGGFFTGAPTELHQELKSEHKGGQSNVLTRRVKKIQRRSPVLRYEEKKENYTKQDGSRSTKNVVILALRDSP